MEIKKGISQMAEYPNVEINYVVPENGKMYYVLRDGELSNGCIIATLDPKRAIDPNVVSNSIGVFKEDGSILIDFDKKDVRRINDELVLAVNSVPTTPEVVNALKNESDDISKTMMKDNATTIVDKMMIEMGITGEILFSDAYSEANIYKLDSFNNKIGPDSSFIGKNDKNFYFHTNDATKDTVLVSINGEEVEENVPDTSNIQIPTSDENSLPVVNEETDTEIPTDNNIGEPVKLDISQNILEGFKPMENSVDLSSDTVVETDTPVETPVDTQVEEPVDTSNETPMETPIDTSVSFASVDNTLPFATESVEQEQSEVEKSPVEIEEKANQEINKESDAVLDNVIEVMKKMIEETSKLNERITELEKELESKQQELDEKNEVISREESKKSTLNDLLDEANEVLEKID